MGAFALILALSGSKIRVHLNNNYTRGIFISIFIWALSCFAIAALCYLMFSNENISDFFVGLIDLTKYIIAGFVVTKIAKILYCLFYSLVTKDWSSFKNIEFSGNNGFDHLKSSREWAQKSSDDFHRLRTDYGRSYSPTNIHYRHD
jgi:hypothetical protein